MPIHRQVINPLTDEQLIVRNIINETVDTARLTVLRTIDRLGGSATRTEIIDESGVSRQAVSDHRAVLRDWGFIRTEGPEIELTAGGVRLVDVVETCLQTISQQELAFLTRSDNSLDILQELEKEAYQISKLQLATENSPSKSTIRRILGDLLENGWTENEGRKYQITTAGQCILDAYHMLSLAVQQLIEKAPWLQRLPVEDATFPIPELAEAKLVISNPASPVSVLSTVLTLYDWDVSRFRGLCSIYHPILFRTYREVYELFNRDIKSEIIFDRTTFEQIANNDKTRYVLDFPSDPGYNIYALEQEKTLGLGIYDERRVAIGAYNDTGHGNHIAMIVSSNDQLVEWGIELFESYQAHAYHTGKMELTEK